MTFQLPSIDPRDPLPIYAQLERAIRQMVIGDVLKVGDQLPTVRQLAVDLKINANTVAKVYAELERDGLIETRRGIGSFIARAERSPGKRERQKQLSEFTARMLSEASRSGFTLEEIITHLQSHQKK